MPTTTSTVALISANIFMKKSVIPSICFSSSKNPTTTVKNYLFYSVSTVRNKYSKFSSVSFMFSKTPPEFPTPQQIPEQEDPSSFPKEIPEIHTPPDIDPIPPEKVADPPPEFSPGPDVPSPDFPGPPLPSPPGPDIPSPPVPDIPLPPPDILPPPPDDFPPPRPPGILPPPSTPPDILPPMGLYFG